MVLVCSGHGLIHGSCIYKRNPRVSSSSGGDTRTQRCQHTYKMAGEWASSGHGGICLSDCIVEERKDSRGGVMIGYDTR